jgi:hypothetical protein
MSKTHKESFFWTSYSDLMTSLFFVMLVLFILVIVLLHNKMSNQDTTITDLEKLRDSLNYALSEKDRLLKIDEQFKPLIQSGKFIYFPVSKKFVAKDLIGHEIFEPGRTVILDQYKEPAINVGKEVESLLKKLSAENKDFSYQLIIEGNMANTWDRRYNTDNVLGYKTSYERALAVYLLWQQQEDIDLRKYNTEILICGSGFNGLDRDSTEENNKRFSIQIIPKVSSPKTDGL